MKCENTSYILYICHQEKKIMLQVPQDPSGKTIDRLRGWMSVSGHFRGLVSVGPMFATKASPLSSYISHITHITHITDIDIAHISHMMLLTFFVFCRIGQLCRLVSLASFGQQRQLIFSSQPLSPTFTPLYADRPSHARHTTRLLTYPKGPIPPFLVLRPNTNQKQK